MNPDAPIVLTMKTTLADAVLWFLQQLSVWTVEDAATVALICCFVLFALNGIGMVLRWTWESADKPRVEKVNTLIRSQLDDDKKAPRD